MSAPTVTMVPAALVNEARPVYHSPLGPKGRPRCNRRPRQPYVEVLLSYAVKFARPCGVCFLHQDHP